MTNTPFLVNNPIVPLLCKITDNKILPPLGSSQKPKSFFFVLTLEIFVYDMDIHHHEYCNFFSVCSQSTLQPSKRSKWKSCVFPTGGPDFFVFSIPILASFYLKFSYHFSSSFMLSLHLQLSLVLISLHSPFHSTYSAQCFHSTSALRPFLPSHLCDALVLPFNMCQNLLLTAIYIQCCFLSI